VKSFGKYGRTVSWIVKWYGKKGLKGKSNSDKIWAKWKTDKLNSEMILKIWKKVVKRFGKYRRKLWKDMENMEEKWVE
jgi:hypothetical protein